jgi:hypothetical protein
LEVAAALFERQGLGITQQNLRDDAAIADAVILEAGSDP